MSDPLFSPLSLMTGRALPGMTRVLVALNVLVFVAMLWGGAGFWHSPNTIQLAWGANFAPATANGQWWRLASAMFLHFGALHLGMNMWALWDGGKLVERMYGAGRFLAIYIIAGVSGNLLSLVVQGNAAVSGGASGAIFGVYGSLLVYLWFARHRMQVNEFRWLFWGALAFSILTIAMGFIVPGIDNAAHIGGLVTGLLAGVVLFPVGAANPGRLPRFWRSACGAGWLLAMLTLCLHLPVPKYSWHDELAIQKQIRLFSQVDQQANHEWQTILQSGQRGEGSFDALATQIDQQVAKPYEDSFEALSVLPDNPNLPSASVLEQAKAYALQRRETSKAAADRLRNMPFMPARP